MHEHYEDYPWREQALYAFDSRNQALYGYYAFGNYDFAAGRVPTPSGPISVKWERTPRGITIEAIGPKDLRPEVQSHPECPVTRARYNGVAVAPK